MKITCYICDKIMSVPGALVYSPPLKNNKEMSMCTVHKYHVCVECWKNLLKYINGKTEENK